MNIFNNLKNAKVLSFSTVIRRRYSLPEVPWRGIHNVIAAAMSIGVAFSNKVMDTPELPQPIKRHVAPKYDICSVGRSMIEMLGVLAIIAVLSVGGIAGYSKAMQQWKISRQKQQIAELFMQCINLKDDFLREYNRTRTRVPTAEIMDAMGVIPDGMKKLSNYNIKDFADNNILIYFTESRWSDEFDENKQYSALEYLLIFDIFQSKKSSKLSQQYCVTFLEQAQAFSAYIKGVQSRASDDSYHGYNAKSIEIASAKPHEIHNFCKVCNSDKACTLVLYFKL